ncbi:MAG: MmcQ/YjbR family DNA-binding protein [Bacteroidota bacterium]
MRIYCLSKDAVTESFPFDEWALVFKVGSKLFAITNVDSGKTVNLKNTPEENIRLREHYQGIEPGYHMNKKHWNTVDIQSDVPDGLLKEMIDTSYELVKNALTKKERSALNLL